MQRDVRCLYISICTLIIISLTVIYCFVEILTLKEVFQIASNGKCKIVLQILQYNGIVEYLLRKSVKIVGRPKVITL